MIDYIMSFDMHWWMDLLVKIFSSPLKIFGFSSFVYFTILTCILKYNKKHRGDAWKDDGAELAFAIIVFMILFWIFLFLPVAIAIAVLGLLFWAIISFITYLVNKS